MTETENGGIGKKKIILIGCIAVVFLAIVIGMIIFLTRPNHYNRATKIMKQEIAGIDEDFKVSTIYYSEKEDGYLVTFVSRGKRDVAAIEIGKEKVGLVSQGSLQAAVWNYNQASGKSWELVYKKE